MASWIEKYGTLQEWATNCPLCHGQLFPKTGMVISAFRTEDEAKCPCWYLFSAMQRLWEQEFPKGYLRWNWDSTYPYGELHVEHEWYQRHPESYVWSFSVEDEVAVRYWVNNPTVVANKGLSLVIHGDKGVGKSSLATVLAKEMTKRLGIDATGFTQFKPRFLVGDELYQYLSTKDWKGMQVANEAMRCDLLVIDDLRLSYTGYAGSELIERVHSFLQYRSGSDLSTIITTNKLGITADFADNAVTQFLGVSGDKIPDKFGKYRYIRVTNKALRPEPDWDL